MKPEILYIAHRIPYPPNKGDKIRSFNEIKYLSKSFTIDLVCLADAPGDEKFQEQLKGYCRQVAVFPLNPFMGKVKGLFTLLMGKSISQGYFFHLGMAATIKKWLAMGSYRAIVCFSSPMAVYLDFNWIHQKRKPLCLMDFCDLDSDKWLQYAKSKGPIPGLLYRLESIRLLQLEKKINQSFDSSIFVSHKEVDLFTKSHPKARNLAAISNGVDVDYFSPRAEYFSESLGDGVKEKTGPVLMFTGVMDYYANIDGVLWFCQKIFPLIKKYLPGVSLVIAGSNPVPAIQNLDTRDDICVTGFVPDIRPWYGRADICIVPLRIARGVQNKVLEAMSMAKPVVSTPAALQGIAAVPGQHLLSAHHAQDFARSVINLLENSDHARALGQRARQFVKTEHSWSTCLKPFEELIP